MAGNDKPIIIDTLSRDWRAPRGRQPAVSLYSEYWAVIWKADNEPIMRNPLWEFGFEPTWELALEKVEKWIEEKPERMKRYWNGIFYPVRVDVGVKLAMVKDKPKAESFG